MSTAEQTKQTEDSTPKRYQLTAEERQTLHDLNNVAAAQKLAVYDLNMQLEHAQAARDQAQAMFSGALSMLANAHQMPGAALSPDFTTLTGATK